MIHAYWFTFLIAIVATVLVNIVSLAIAVALNARIKWKTTLRGVYFIPNVLAILVDRATSSTTCSTNSLPALGEKLGIDFLSTSLLTKASTAWIGIVILAVWQAAAFNIIIYIAGLQTVPEELYEAAALDGASAVAAVPQHHVPDDRGLLHHQHGARRSRASCRSSTTSSP